MNNTVDEALILVVDDNDSARYVKVRTLRNAGFRTIEAAYGQEALELTQTQKPDLVLLDIKLPDIDGFEVCRRLRADVVTSSLPIVQISATFESAEHQVRGLEGGADTFLVSPVEPTVLVATVRAMLRLRRAEARLREFDRRKDEFLATVAHELRNPLAPLRYCLDSLGALPTDAAHLQTCLGIMRRQTDHLIRLVDDLADMSRITQNKLTLQLERVKLAEILETAIEARRPEIEAKNHTVTTRLDDDAIALYADSVRLAQIFGNLLSNSIKYTEPGGLIELVAQRESPDYVAVSVVDNGAGIATTDLERIFDLFVQVRHHGAGLGIGLALVNRIVQMHGGSVRVASAGLGRGSTFTVRLPLFAPGLLPKEEVGAHDQSAAAYMKKVLVVDDNVDAVDAMVRLLRGMNQEVRASYGGYEAIAVANEFRPDVIFMDIAMPDLDGLQAVQRIRRQPWSTQTLICTVSGHGQPADRERSAEAGADFHIVKPIGQDNLKQMLVRSRGGAASVH